MKRVASYFLAGCLLLSGAWLLPVQGQISYAPRIPQTVLFTVVGANTLTLPFGINTVQVILVGGGGGGAGGHVTGGGGGGGGGSCASGPYTLATAATGPTLTITVGAKGTGGAIQTDGVNGGVSTVTGGLHSIPASGFGERGFAGAATNGGNSGASYCDAGSMISTARATGGVAAGANGIQFSSNGAYAFPAAFGSSGGAGAGTGSGGAGSARSFLQTALIAGGANVGGGAGGGTLYSNGGIGGATSVAGTACTALQYGSGGGGGGQNAAGANGCDGLVIITY